MPREREGLEGGPGHVVWMTREGKNWVNEVMMSSVKRARYCEQGISKHVHLRKILMMQRQEHGSGRLVGREPV